MRDSPNAVTATGATHVPLPAEADYDEQIFEQFPERAHLKGAKAIAFDVEHVFAKPAKAQYHALLDAHRQRPADAVLSDPAFSAPRSCWRTTCRPARRW